MVPVLSRRRLAQLLAVAPLASCGPSDGPPPPAPGSLEWAVSGEWRIDRDRDQWRHPLETLSFWGIRPNMTVLEVMPGRGWYTSIIAPYLARGGGRLYAASFDPASATPAQRETLADFQQRFHDAREFGRIERTVVGPGASLAPTGSVDLAILANSLHTLMAQGMAERVFAGVYAALKVGGAFGIEQHRASDSGDPPDPTASNGYVQEAWVKKIAHEAGFEFTAASDINANPRDKRDHPFGVWTLPPTLRTAPLGQPDNPEFDTAPYIAIGESDRMTLKFRKPGGPPAPPPRLRSGAG